MLSQTTEYARRATICLSYTNEGLVSTSELAEVTKVPMNYLAKVLQLLARADIVTGRRGVGGGYRLTREPKDISMLDVINAIDPIKRISSCPLKLSNHTGGLCPLHHKLDESIGMLMDQFTGVSMADLLGERGDSRPLCDTERTAKVELTLGGTK